MKHVVPVLLLLASCHEPVPSGEDLVTHYWRPSPAAAGEAAPVEPEGSSASRAPGESEVKGGRVPSEGGWTLEQILARIRHANPDLASARARVAAAEAARSEATAAYYPSLALSHGYLATDNPGTAFGLLLNQQRLTLGPGFDPTPGWTENWRTEVRLDVELFSPGRTDRKQAAGAGARGAELVRQAAERRLLNAGIQGWLGLRAANALLEVARRTVGVVEERLERMRVREREGAALRADVLRLEVRRAEAVHNAQQAELGVRQSESQLQALMGLGGDERIELAPEPVSFDQPAPLSLEAALAHAREHRLDLLAKAEGLRTQELLIRAAKAGYLPRLLAYGAYDIDGPDSRLDLGLDSYATGVMLEWRLSGRTGPRVRRARAERDRAGAELRAATTAVSREVADAWAARDVANRGRELARAARAAAEEAYRIVAAAQEAGGATVTDLLEAENARDQAAVREVVSQASVDIARARLAAAMGEVR